MLRLGVSHSSPPDAPMQTAPATPLFGRDAEMAALRGLLSRVAEGVGGAVLVEGVGGIGKTCLVDAIADEARSLGFEIYQSRAEELEQSIPLAPVRRVLARLREDTDRAFAMAAESGSVDALVDVLEMRALQQPVLLVVEDLHWADSSTLSFVGAACRRVLGLPLGVVATLRPPTGRPEVVQLEDRLSREGVDLIRLGALDPPAVERLSNQVLRANPSPALSAKLTGASGNPFYIVEFLTALKLDGAIRVTEGRADITDASLPLSLRLTIIRRIASLPVTASDIVRTASVLGSSFTAEELASVTRRSPIELLEQLAPAMGAGFIRPIEDRIGFDHDLVREAIYDDIPASVRKAIHRQMARDLADLGRPAATVAAHMAAGADKGDREAVDWLVRAAEESGQGTIGAIKVGVETVVHTDLLLRGAELCLDDDPRRFELLARAVLGLAATYRAAEAETLARELLDDPRLPAALEPVVRHGLANALGPLGRADEARGEWRSIRDHRDTSAMLQNHAESELAMSAVLSGDIDEAERLAHQTLAQANEHDHPWPPCQAQMTLSLVAAARGRVSEAMDRARLAIPLADRDWELGGGLSGARLFSALALMDADRLNEAEEAIRVDYGRARRDHLGRSAVERQVGLAALDYIAGAWDDALVEMSSALAFDVDERLELFVGLAIVSRIHLHRGEIVKATESLERSDERLAQFGPGVGVDLLLWCRALVEWNAGRLSEAFSLLESIWDATANMRFAFGTWRHIWPDLICIAREVGRRDIVDQVVLASREGARAAERIGSADASAMWISGLASNDGSMIADAADALSATPRVVEAARASEHAGVALLNDDHDASVRYLMRALDNFQRLDASADVDRVRARLREAGVRIGTRGSRRRPAFGWEALTPSELRIVALVAEGLSNAQVGERLFISRRTVQSHLANVFTKLGVSARAEVVAESMRRSGVPARQR